LDIFAILQAVSGTQQSVPGDAFSLLRGEWSEGVPPRGLDAAIKDRKPGLHSYHGTCNATMQDAPSPLVAHAPPSSPIWPLAAPASSRALALA